MSQVGNELTEQGGPAISYALTGILIDIMAVSSGTLLRMRSCHWFSDVVITRGVSAFFQFDFDPAMFAAHLAVIGYSLNDTIGVFDHDRENFRKMSRADLIPEQQQ